MEGLDEQTLEELKAKAIERGGDEEITTNEINEEFIDEVPVAQAEEEAEPVKEVKKPKRARSDKQKAAFEKARLARAENLKIKKQIEAEKKQKQKDEKEQVKIEVKKRLSEKETPVAVKNPVYEKPVPAPILKPQERYREQVVNNYYYYGTPAPVEEQRYVAPPAPAPAPVPRKKKVEIQEPEPYYSSSEEEEIVYSDPDEPQSFKELQNYVEEPERQAPQQNSNGLKFRFA
tara:strand:- start:826 stop:1521 length:696 start_codon:yes stop_codon:yes gene_type:complete